MKTFARLGLIAISLIQLASALGLFMRLPWLTAFWPFPGTTPLTYIFLASIVAAAAAATLWVAATENYAALAGIALDYVVILVPTGIYGIWLGARGGGLPFLVLSGLLLLGAVFGVTLLVWSLFLPLDRSRPMPGPVRWSFVVFVVALLIVSTRLIWQAPNTLPWTVTPELSVMIGWMFFGAATYFVYGLLRPSWANAGGQLAGFLAYDLVLIVPFLVRLPTVAPEHRLSLILYITVVVYSGLLASHYLFINRATRLWRPKAQPAPAPAAL